MIDDEHTTDTHLGGRNIYTARDWKRGMVEAWRIEERAAARELWEHAPHAHHCGGYDVHAWPCPTAAKVLHKLLRDGYFPSENHVPIAALIRDELARRLHEVEHGVNENDDPDDPCWTGWRPDADALMPIVQRRLHDAWEEGARDGGRGLLPEYKRTKRNPYRGGTA